MSKFALLSLRALVPSVGLALLAASCSEKESGGLMLVFRTDMTVPEPVSRVGVYIQKIEGSARTLVLAKEVDVITTEDGTRKAVLPGNLAVESGEADTSVRVRVVAYDRAGKALAMREAQSSVPISDVRALAMPLLWMNTDDIVSEPQVDDPFVRLRSSTCAADETLDDTGACAPIAVDVARLPAWTERVDAPDGGTCADCFDVRQCFPGPDADDPDPVYQVARPKIEWLDDGRTECGVDLGENGEMIRSAGAAWVDQQAAELSVAVRAPASDGAQCGADGERCYVTLDRASGLTLRERAKADGVALLAVLPAGVCRKWRGGEGQGVVGAEIAAVPTCVRKRPDQRVCEPNERGCRDGKGWDGRALR